MESEYLNLLRLFHAEGVDYVVVGGYAVIAHGFPRTTGDIDILVRPTAANAVRVVRALVSYGFVKGEFEETDFTTTPNFLSFSKKDVWIDLMTQLLGVTFEECATDTLLVEVEGVSVRYINLAALRKAKAATRRPQDLQDLENLPPTNFTVYPPFVSMPDITASDLKQRLQAGETPTIIDVREPWEVEESRIAGSQNIPLGNLPAQLDDLEDLKDQEVIVHCKSGARSSAAKAFLTQQGFTNVRNLEGGMLAYQGVA